MIKDITNLPFDKLFQYYKKLVEERERQLLEGSRSDAFKAWTKAHEARVALAQANDSGEDNCYDKWDAYYREANEFVAKDWEIPEKLKLEIRNNARDLAIEKFVTDFNLHLAHDWLPYQLISYFGNWKAIKVGDKYNATATLRSNFSDFNMGVALLAIAPRKALFDKAPKQFKQYNSSINPLVPIILAGFKQSQGIKYSEWSVEGIDKLVGVPLADVMTCSMPQLQVGELLVIRSQCITDMLGPRAGVPNNPVSTVKLNKSETTPLAVVPKLARYIAIQTWCAHPANWTANTLLDTTNWDNRPEPLVTSDLLSTAAEVKPKWTSKIVLDSNMPW
jgi:hypothetical protein